MSALGRGIRRLTMDDQVGISNERGPAWDEYLRIASEVEPGVIQSLLALELHNNDVKLWREDEKQLREWCNRWGFSFQYAEIPARNTWVAIRRRTSKSLPIPIGFMSNWAGWPYPAWEEPDIPSLPSEIWAVAVGGESAKSHPPFEMPGRLYDPPDEKGRVRIGRGHQVLVPAFFWNPTRESRAEAQTRILADVREAVTRDLVAIESAYLEHGHRPIYELRETNAFEWLARIQTHQDSIPSIANEARVSEAFVRTRVNTAQQLLGIQRHRVAPGRPRTRRSRVVRNPRSHQL